MQIAWQDVPYALCLKRSKHGDNSDGVEQWVWLKWSDQFFTNVDAFRYCIVGLECRMAMVMNCLVYV